MSRISLQLVKATNYLPFRLENCYPYKMLELGYVTADYGYFSRIYEWKRDTVRQIVAFKNRLNNEPQGFQVKALAITAGGFVNTRF
jgi:hypothetical protein